MTDILWGYVETTEELSHLARKVSLNFMIQLFCVHFLGIWCILLASYCDNIHLPKL